MSRKFEVQRDDLIVDPQVFQCHVGKGFQPFVAGTDPLKQIRPRPWTLHLTITLGLVAVFAFLNRAIFAWEWDWVDNLPVFIVFILSPIIAFMWGFFTFFAFRERNSPDEPTHLLAGTVTKWGRPNNGTRSITVEYPLPEGGVGKAVGVQVGKALQRGTPVAVLHYDKRKASALL